MITSPFGNSRIKLGFVITIDVSFKSKVTKNLHVSFSNISLHPRCRNGLVIPKGCKLHFIGNPFSGLSAKIFVIILEFFFTPILWIKISMKKILDARLIFISWADFHKLFSAWIGEKNLFIKIFQNKKKYFFRNWYK